MSEFPSELWIACFVKDGKRIVRKFWAAGYYDAYDKVLRYAEKRRVNIEWFTERIYCHHIRCRELESFCVYCNRMFDGSNSIECSCKAVLCSIECYNGHKLFKHKGSS